MNVRRIIAHGFMGYGDVDLLLPKRGVVLITGPNGSGKSALVEAVSWAVWGSMLRGTKRPWSDKECSSYVEFDDVSVKRTKRGSASPSLSWSRGDEHGCEAFDTTTHAQNALEAIVGDFAAWRRTHVFSSQDVDTFAAGTDAKRKRLLEALLDLDRYDAADKLAAADLADAERVAKKAELSKEYSRANVQASRAELDRLRTELEAARRAKEQVIGPPEFVPTEEDLRALFSARSDLSAKRNRLRAELGARQEAYRRARAQSDRLSGEQCPMCGQDIGAGLRMELEHDVALAEKDAAEARSRAEVEGSMLDELIAEVESEVEEAREVMKRAELAAGAAVAAAAREARALEEVKECHKRGQHHAAEVRKSEKVLVESSRSVEELSVVRRVLGTRGVRAHLLNDALDSLQTAANAWLARLGGGIEVSLSSWREQASGKIADELDLRVIGAGGDEGYRACSGGQRRRIDLSLLMGLADLSSAASGRTAGTLWFDEAFDALDAEARGALADVVRELAATRCVVIVTHNDDLLAHLWRRSENVVGVRVDSHTLTTWDM